MAQTIASMIVDIGAKVTGFEQGAKKVKKDMDDVALNAEIAAKKTAMLGTVVTATTALIVDSYKEYSTLSESIRDLSLVSGESAENTSRFIQVLDDFQLTADDATAAAKKLKENGLSPSIETLAELSDQFRGIQDPAERMDFVYDKLGKSGAKFINMLNQGSDAIRENAAAINESLIMSDMEIKMYEVGRLAIDAKMDALAAFRVELGQNVGNVLAFASAMERANEIQEEGTIFVNGHKERTIEYADALNMAIAEQLKAAETSAEYKYNLEEEKRAAEEAAQALKELSAANMELVSVVERMQGITESFAEQYKSVNEDMKLTDEERAARIAEIAAQEEEANRRIILSMLEKQLAIDGLNTQETEYLLSKGLEWGIYSEEVVAAAKAAQAEVLALSSEISAVPEGKTITFDVITNGAPPNLDPTATAAPVGTHRGSRKASGGQVWSGQSYMVGEQGMEIFTPNQNGMITPNSRATMGSGGTDPRIITLLEQIANKQEMSEDRLAMAVVSAVQQGAK